MEGPIRFAVLRDEVWPGETTPQLRALATLAGDLGSVPSAHIAAHSYPGHLTPSAMGFHGHWACTWCTSIHAGKIHSKIHSKKMRGLEGDEGL